MYETITLGMRANPIATMNAKSISYASETLSVYRNKSGIVSVLTVRVLPVMVLTAD